LGAELEAKQLQMGGELFSKKSGAIPHSQQNKLNKSFTTFTKTGSREPGAENQKRARLFSSSSSQRRAEPLSASNTLS